MNRLSRLALVVPALGALACGDGAICPSETLVAITSPTNGDTVTNADDRDLNLEGVQINVPVRSNLPPGGQVNLRVIVEGDDNEDVVVSAEVGEDGRTVFENVTLPYGNITIRASAAEDECGDSTDGVAVRVVEPTDPPPAVVNVAVETPLRNLAVVSFAEPNAAVAGFIVRVADEPLTETNFNITGEEITAPAVTGPGSAHTLDVTPLRPEADYYIGIATVDSDGTRSVAAIAGPAHPRFDRTGAILPPFGEGASEFGYKMVHGFFNGDGFRDVAVSAPRYDAGGTDRGGVFIYFGSENGIGTTPDVTIVGLSNGGQLGKGMAALDWNGDDDIDLALSAPSEDGNDGVVYIFDHAALSGSIDTSAAAVTIVPADGGGNLFDGGLLGFDLAAGRFDDDARDDLVIGAPFAGDGTVIFLYGGNTATSIVLDDGDDGTLLGGGVAHYMEDPDGSGTFGFRIQHLGRTQGVFDDDDDFAISHFAHDVGYVIRGRIKPVSGVAETTFDNVLDLEVTATSGTDAMGNAAATIGDVDGDGVPDVAMGAWRESSDAGAVWVLSGAAAGATDTDSDDVLLSIVAGPGVDLFGTEILGSTVGGADVDVDGIPDLVVVGRQDGVLAMYIWYGDTLPLGSTTTDSADTVIFGPADFEGIPPGNDDRPAFGVWAGDVNADGLLDICWSDYISDGQFEVLWDDGVSN